MYDLYICAFSSIFLLLKANESFLTRYQFNNFYNLGFDNIHNNRK